MNDYVSLLSDADKVVKSYTLYKRFIDGTPLSNDIAVWMAEFARNRTQNSLNELEVYLIQRAEAGAFDMEGAGSDDFIRAETIMVEAVSALRELGVDFNPCSGERALIK